MPGPQLYGKPTFMAKPRAGHVRPLPLGHFKNSSIIFSPTAPGFFRVELAAEDAAVAGGGADLAPAVDSVGQAVLIADGLGLVAVDKIALLAGLERGQRRAGKIRAPPPGYGRADPMP